jgi:hypothetical protein
LLRDGKEYQLIKGEGGSWDALPAEDWIILDAAQTGMLLPTGTAKPGLGWAIPPALAKTLLQRFYPPTENNDLSTNQLIQSTLTGQVMEVKNGIVRAQLRGSLNMKHPFYPGREDKRHAKAKLIGWVEWESRSRRLRSLEIVTDEGTYADEPLPPDSRPQAFGVALRKVP